MCLCVRVRVPVCVCAYMYVCVCVYVSYTYWKFQCEMIKKWTFGVFLLTCFAVIFIPCNRIRFFNVIVVWNLMVSWLLLFLMWMVHGTQSSMWSVRMRCCWVFISIYVFRLYSKNIRGTFVLYFYHCCLLWSVIWAFFLSSFKM